MNAEVFTFGTLSTGEPVSAARLTNARGMAVTVLDYGATIQSLVVPDKHGNPVDVVLGYDTAAEYEANDGYLGATVGRVANRIGGAAFTLNGTTYRLAKNDGENHLHGGLRGFDKHIWDMQVEGDRIICTRLSPDGEEGYPGNLAVTVTFRLTEDGALHIIYDADTDADTPVNLTNHSYFNLDSSADVLTHKLQVFADRFCENDAGCLPTGRLLDVTGTPFDFRTEKAVGADIGADHEQLRLAGGYDHNYCLSEGDGTMPRRAAVLRSDASGIRLTANTDRPGMQVYSSNFLTRRAGKGGRIMDCRGALCLETQLNPNALALPAFPSPILRAGQHLHTETVYSFSTRADAAPNQ
ncbi:MAG: galactose mutarotase [Eggerthellaceae bacterium]|nr:galactose mutarotase [Eggerthellaceae bacterium]